MKTLITAILLSALAYGSTSIPITWDAMANVDGFNIYSGETLLGTVQTNVAEVTIPDATTTLMVAAFNMRGEGPRSEPLVIPALPPAVKAYVVTIDGKITITIRAKTAAE